MVDALGPLLILGVGGQLGSQLLAASAAKGLHSIGSTRTDCSISDAQAVEHALRTHRPRLVVNAAAYTAVDRAETEVELARLGNITGPAILAERCAAAGIPLLHVSTDYVFDGSKSGAYCETDPIAPLGTYGQTKAEGEAKVRLITGRHIILRTAWVYGIYGQNFLKTMLRLAGEREELRVVADQFGSPTATDDLAAAILAVDAAVSAGAQPWGTYHFAGSGITSWHGFAEAIVSEAAKHTGRLPVVTKIGTWEFPTPARRPANSVLDSTLFLKTFGYRSAAWRDRVDEIVPKLLSA